MPTKVDTQRNANVILCVDDEVNGLDVRKALLASRGYRVLTATNGPDALVLFSSEAMDLVILDYRMPGMNGDIVASRMKELRPDLPIIMLSAYVDLPNETLTLVDRVVMKGEPPTVLLHAITALLGDRLSVFPRMISPE
jgi:CheY-like chemotaxis protein